MNPAETTLLEQMRITEFDLEYRQQLLGITEQDINNLADFSPVIEDQLDKIVSEFYFRQTEIPEIANLIGDADTLKRLRYSQRTYILDLFGGEYGLDYVNNRLRIGLVHKRIGVEPKLYLSAMSMLRELLMMALEQSGRESAIITDAKRSLDKLLFFDITLVFEFYTRSLVTELESERNKAEHYAHNLEKQVHERTQMMRTDPLTGVFNRRNLLDTIRSTLNAAQRRTEPVAMLFIDINDFKQINDTLGHHHGDMVLTKLGEILICLMRSEDACFRLGGDEFVVVLSNMTEGKAISVFGKRVTELLGAQLPGVTISVGVVQTGPTHYATPDEFLKQADQRMYRHKSRSKMQQQIDGKKPISPSASDVVEFKKHSS